MADEDTPLPKPASGRRKLLWAAGIGATIYFGLRLLVPSYTVTAGSMLPTLAPGDRFLIDVLAYTEEEIQRGDLIVFDYPFDDDTQFVKRVMGLPGDEVFIDDPQVSIKRRGSSEFEVVRLRPLELPCTDDEVVVSNCTVYEESIGDRSYHVRYRRSFREGADQEPEPSWVVPDGHLFVLGDNRNDSLDSRRWDWPYLPLGNVRGRAVRVWWPRWATLR